MPGSNANWCKGVRVFPICALFFAPIWNNLIKNYLYTATYIYCYLCTVIYYLYTTYILIYTATYVLLYTTYILLIYWLMVKRKDIQDLINKILGKGPTWCFLSMNTFHFQWEDLYRLKLNCQIRLQIVIEKWAYN